MSARALICLAVIGLAPAAYGAANAGSQRPCQEQDLIGGTWEMVQFQESPPSHEDAWIKDIPYQYLAFYPDHFYVYLAADAQVKTPTALQKDLLWPQKGNHVLQYALDAKGTLTLYLDKKVKYNYHCVAVTASGGVYMKNDLIMTGYSMDDSGSTIYKLYRRWY